MIWATKITIILNNPELFPFQATLPPSNETMTSDSVSYQRCLLPNLAQDKQHTVNTVTNYVLVPLNLLLAVLSLVINLLVLTAVIRTRYLQHPLLLLMCSLSIADVLWAMYSLVVDTARITHDEFCTEELSAFAQAFSVFCYSSTLVNLAVISKDRYLAVRKPLLYRSNLTLSFVLKKASAVWSFCVLFLILKSLSEYIPSLLRPFRVVTVLLYVISIIIIIYSYTGIFFANKRHRQVMHQHNAQIRLAILKREKKLTNTVGLILIALCFTFLPALISPLILSIQGFSGSDFIPYRPFYALFITLNGLLNPLLNYGRNGDVRDAVRRLIICHQITAREQPVTRQRPGEESANNLPTAERTNSLTVTRGQFKEVLNTD